ncbi:MAG: hypothetical protein MJY56_03860, partial [Bacteroidales bacterium]|nr:hypothetical protein [Bacteroidales bacterium]
EGPLSAAALRGVLCGSGAGRIVRPVFGTCARVLSEGYPEAMAFLDPLAAEPMTWVALDPQGNWMTDYPEPKDDKTVGIFYFLWHGCHGYDTFENHNSVVYPDGTDTRSPYNNELLYNPADPQKSNFGPFNAFHHWGEPYLGYYIADDDWVFRKHAQMLTDAGVDVIYIDATNGFDYIDNLKVLCEEFDALRAKGCRTPQFAYLLNSEQDAVFKRLLSEIYTPRKYKDLWFQWKGKPLLLAYEPALTPTKKTDFTIRYSWFYYKGIPGMDDWYDNVAGEDKWPWGSWYPQKPGMHGGEIEEASVMAATHPLDNIGRSFDPVTWTEPDVKVPEKGIHFWKQFEKAMSYNPKHLFFTGWNEWMAMRLAPSENSMLGMSSTEFGCQFVDHFNHEYSRDLEPVRGGFGDTYYYYLADMCRKFKGTPERPVYSKTYDITLDDNAADWYSVDAAYGDDCGDATEHKHIGYGKVGMLTNTTAKNDIELCKVATDGTNLYFYAQTASKFKNVGSADWMKLFIGVEPGPGSSAPAWEGFHFVVKGLAMSAKKVNLEVSEGGYSWKKIEEVDCSVNDRFIEVAVPLASLGIKDPSKFMIDFKWIDNAAKDGDIQTCLSDGDSAPDGRFRYRYVFDSSAE